ncbi:MAG TPA: LacI family DNA-binding transcriptional regulator [Cellulomonas sp.]
MTAQVTLSDVAREAGVSLATASRALNGSATRTVGEPLRLRVEDAARRLRYTPDGIAQAMARGRTTSLGLVLPDITDPRYATVASGVVAAASAAGLTVALTVSGGEAEREVDLVQQMERQRARGVVIVGGGRGAAGDEAEEPVRAALASFRETGGGAAVIGRPGLGVDCVDAGESDAAVELARAMHGLGYRRVVLLAGTDRAAVRRGSALLRAFAELGMPLPEDRVIGCPPSREGGYRVVRDLLAAGVPVDLVAAVDDARALGALAATREARRAPGTPDGVAVSGFDGVEGSEVAIPPLTTVRVPYARLGEEAVALLLAATDGRRPAASGTQAVPAPVEQTDGGSPRGRRRVRVPSEVVLRASTSQD